MRGFGLLLLLSLGPYQTGPAGAHVLRFSMERKGVLPPQYTVELDEGTGAGSYAAGADRAVAGGGAAPLQVSPAVLRKLLAAVPAVRAQHCETHSKGIAQTGRKMLRYAGDGPPVECTYNYSDDERVNEATSTFEAIAETMQFGERLNAKLRFDRLGLDAEVDGLVEAVAGGRAMELVNIAPVLKSITEDERVMERVRRKTARLLENAGSVQARADRSER